MPQSWWAEVAEGAAYIRRTPLLLHPTVAIGLALLVIGFAESAIYAVVEAFREPASFIGPMLPCRDRCGRRRAGGQPRREEVRRARHRRARAGGRRRRGSPLVMVVDRVWELMAAVGVLGAGLPLIFVAFSTLLQQQTPAG